jgi:hypothetical protein
MIRIILLSITLSSLALLSMLASAAPSSAIQAFSLTESQVLGPGFLIEIGSKSKGKQTKDGTKATSKKLTTTKKPGDPLPCDCSNCSAEHCQHHFQAGDDAASSLGSSMGF